MAEPIEERQINEIEDCEMTKTTFTKNPCEQLSVQNLHYENAANISTLSVVDVQ